MPNFVILYTLRFGAPTFPSCDEILIIDPPIFFPAGGPDSDTPESELTKAARTTWARLIKKVYEVDPLICPHCGGEMRFLAVIEEPPVIEQILELY